MDACAALGWADKADPVALLVTEVATNAVLHAPGDEIRVRLLDQGQSLRVEVYDGNLAAPVAREARTTDENGRGLLLLDAFASGWGVEPRPDGKVFWFQIDR